MVSMSFIPNTSFFLVKHAQPEQHGKVKESRCNSTTGGSRNGPSFAAQSHQTDLRYFRQARNLSQYEGGDNRTREGYSTS